MKLPDRLRRLFGAHPNPTDPFADIDPLKRRAGDEPVFPLMGRDKILGPYWARMYGDALDRKDRAKIHAILDAALDRFYATPHRPGDTRKAHSARYKATQMELWYVENVATTAPGPGRTAQDREPLEQRTNFDNLTNDDPGALGYHLVTQAIKKAAPPPEPDEAS